MASFTRADPRYAVALAVRVSCDSWPEYLELHTTDLSRGGVFVATRISAPIGTEVLVELGLPTGVELKLRAEVVHIFEASPEADSPGRPPGLGLMFLSLEEETRVTLDAMLTIARATARPPTSALRPGASSTAITVPTGLPSSAPVVGGEPASVAVAGGEPAPIASARTVASAAVPEVEHVPVPAVPISSGRRAVAPLARASSLPATTVVPPAPRKPVFSEIVGKTLHAELVRREGLLAHEQLGVELDATTEAIDEAYRQLSERYHPLIFQGYGEDTRETVRRLGALLESAYKELHDPETRRALSDTLLELEQSDEGGGEVQDQRNRTEDARRALRASIDSRLEEARRLREADQLEPAIRAFESVLMLDRWNEDVKAELKAVRDRHAAQLQTVKQGRGLLDRFRKH